MTDESKIESVLIAMLLAGLPVHHADDNARTDEQGETIIEYISVTASGDINVTPADAARIICQALHNRKGTFEAWRSVPATIAIHGAQRKSKDEQG